MLPHPIKADAAVPTLRRMLLLALCAILVAGTAAAYVVSYRAQVLAMYTERKTRGIQEAEEVDPTLDSLYTSRLLSTKPSTIGMDSVLAQDVHREAALRVSASAYDRADLFDRIATALLICLGIAALATVITWNTPVRVRPVAHDPMTEALLRSALPRSPTPPKGNPSSRRSRFK